MKCTVTKIEGEYPWHLEDENGNVIQERWQIVVHFVDQTTEETKMVIVTEDHKGYSFLNTAKVGSSFDESLVEGCEEIEPF
jgi:hypothetical protein